MPNLSVNISGYSDIVADSVTTVGNIQGAIVRGTTALEFPAHATLPGVRCITDTDSGIGRTATNEIDIITGGSSRLYTSTAQVLVDSTVETVALGKLESRNKRVRTKRTQDITAAGNTIDVATGNQEVVEITLTAGNIVITSTPFMANGEDGQEVTLVNVQAANTLTLPDESTTPGSNLELRAATRVLAAAGGYLKLRYSTALGAWHEVGFA